MNAAYIDIGSTSIKYRIYDKTTDIYLDKGSRPFPPPLPGENEEHEVMISAIETAVFSILETAAAFACRRVLISVQMHGYILLDGGKPCTNYISWRDRRGVPENPVFDSWDWHARGTSRKRNLPAISLLSLNHLPEQAEFCTLGSYLAYRLTGKNATHITDAAASGLFYVEGCRPTHSLFPQMKLPEATPELKALGRWHGMEIYTPVGDHQASYAGSRAGSDACLLNIGTAAQLSTLSPAPSGDVVYEARPYFQPGIRLCTVTGLIGGDRLAQGCGTRDLIENYGDALRLLPPKRHMILGGGGAVHHASQLAEVCRALGVTYTFADDSIVFEGLKMLDQTIPPKVGIMLSEATFVNFPVIVRQAGLDFLLLDNEHGAFDYAVVSQLALNSKLIGLPLIIRLSDAQRMNITKFADMGAAGFLLPMTDTAGDVAKVVEYAKYTPVGKRGISTTRLHTLYNPPPLAEYMARANETVRVYAQIETRSGVAHIDEILAVPGMDGVFIGPNDLACDLDCIGQKEPVMECIRTVCHAAQKTGKTCGIITTDRALLDCAVECGADMISYGSELNLLLNGCRNIRGMSFTPPQPTPKH